MEKAGLGGSVMRLQMTGCFRLDGWGPKLIQIPSPDAAMPCVLSLGGGGRVVTEAPPTKGMFVPLPWVCTAAASMLESRIGLDSEIVFHVVGNKL